MRNKNNTIPAVFITVSAVLLTVLTANSALAAPNNKVPLTVETAQTMSYTKTNYVVDRKSRLVPLYSIHIYFMRPDSYRTESADGASGNKYKTIAIERGNYHVVYNTLHDGINTFSYNENSLDYYGIPPSPKNIKHVQFNGKPALLYTETTPSGSGVHTIKKVWYDFHTHETLRMVLYNGTFNYKDYQKEIIVYKNWKLNTKFNVSLFDYSRLPGFQHFIDYGNTH